MDTIPVNDAEVRWTIIRYFVGLIELGDIEPLLQSGMTGELLQALRTRSMSDIERIAKDSSIGFELKINAHQLNTAFLRLDDIVRDQKLLEYYVVHQLPSWLLAKMFRRSTSELREMRAALCGPGQETVGRPSMPDVEVRERIHTAWDMVRKTHPERRQFFELHQLFPDHQLNQLWSVVNEFGDITPPGARQTARSGGA